LALPRWNTSARSNAGADQGAQQAGTVASAQKLVELVWQMVTQPAQLLCCAKAVLVRPARGVRADGQVNPAGCRCGRRVGGVVRPSVACSSISVMATLPFAGWYPWALPARLDGLGRMSERRYQSSPYCGWRTTAESGCGACAWCWPWRVLSGRT